MAEAVGADLQKTPLYDWHLARGGRLVGFAGYALPVQYDGIVAEHLHTRRAAGLFDVSHMGQVTVTGPDFETTATALETLLPADILSMRPGEQRYTVLPNEEGGIEDDLIVSRPAEGAAPDGVLEMVVNAARKAHDLALIEAALPPEISAAIEESKALIALQGPRAAEVLAGHTDLLDGLTFMQSALARIGGIAARVSRSGYTGEDGFEISCNAEDAVELAEHLASDERVKPAGLGARDSLRLEAGLCLYGQDLTGDTDPVSAGLLFAIGKRRRREGGFPGAARILQLIETGPAIRRVGMIFEGRVPVRSGAELVHGSGIVVGWVTSGTFSPVLERPIAMGYLSAGSASPGTPVTAMVRGKSITGEITAMPFVPNNYVRAIRKAG